MTFVDDKATLHYQKAEHTWQMKPENMQSENRKGHVCDFIYVKYMQEANP